MFLERGSKTEFTARERIKGVLQVTLVESITPKNEQNLQSSLFLPSESWLLNLHQNTTSSCKKGWKIKGFLFLFFFFFKAEHIAIPYSVGKKRGG